MGRPIYVKFCLGIFDKESRDEREISAAQEAGFDVKVLAAPQKPKDAGKVEHVNGIEVHRFSVRKMPNIFIISYALFLFERFLRALFPSRKDRLIARQLRGFHADVISCHDLNALRIGWMAVKHIPARKRPKLVYDSHEFELGRNMYPPRTACDTRQVARLEKKLMQRCAFSIMVNDSIADRVQQIHGLEKRPLVVRSTPPYWDIDDKIIEQKRRAFLSGFEKKALPSQEPFIAMYHGGIMENRGIETFLSAVSQSKNIFGVILGYALDPNYLAGLKDMANTLGISGRVQFLPAVPLDELWQSVGAADVGVVATQNTCESYYYSLPNKFFENVQSLTPVISSDLPELRRLITQYNIGLLYREDSPEELSACLEKMRTDRVLYTTVKQNVAKAKDELCWEKEKTNLITAFKALLP